MTTKFENFEKELTALCARHGVLLTPSEYDSLQVWDAETGDEVMRGTLEDCTEEVRK